jgi:hypothetical protein
MTRRVFCHKFTILTF